MKYMNCDRCGRVVAQAHIKDEEDNLLLAYFDPEIPVYEVGRLYAKRYGGVMGRAMPLHINCRKRKVKDV